MKLIPLFVLILIINMFVYLYIVAANGPSLETRNHQRSTDNSECACQLDCDTLAADSCCIKPRELMNAASPY